MLGDIIPWSEVHPGDTVLLQGALVKVLSEEINDTGKEVRIFRVAFPDSSLEITTAVFIKWYTARLGNQ